MALPQSLRVTIAPTPKFSIRLRETVFNACKVPVLCDGDGIPLPNQRAVTIVSRLDDVVTATVEFVIGDDLPIVEG